MGETSGSVVDNRSAACVISILSGLLHVPVDPIQVNALGFFAASHIRDAPASRYAIFVGQRGDERDEGVRKWGFASE